jgi:hypothetical protein
MNPARAVPSPCAPAAAVLQSARPGLDSERMPGPASDPAVFIHIKVALGMVVSLGIARLLTGVAKFVQHPGRTRPDWIHLAWAASMLLTLLHFWWWQYRLAEIAWRFENYLFVMGYAALFYLMSALLFPDDIAEYQLARLLPVAPALVLRDGRALDGARRGRHAAQGQ